MHLAGRINVAQMPVEVVSVGSVSGELVAKTISLANSLQSEFVYSPLSNDHAKYLRISAYKKIDFGEMMDELDNFKAGISGYHPFLIAFIDSQITDKKAGRDNLYG